MIEYRVEVYDTGNVYWFKAGTDKLHREGDLPAIEASNGEKYWYIDGELHRVNGPAIDNANGRFWFINGHYHRDGDPAIESANGSKFWYKHGKLHREDGPACEYHNGFDNSWHLNGIKYNSESDWKSALNPVKELSVAEISELLGYEVKVVK